jgi:ABC-2 type transport system ATP-binding protein
VQALEIRQLRKTYRNGREALKGIDLDVAPGEFFALLGPNGAGKSTSIGIITGLVNKTSGQVRVFGHNTDSEWAAAKRCIGVVPQEFNFSQFEPVINVVVNQAGYYGVPRRLAKERAEKYLTALKLWDKRHEAARTLSGGQKRRLMIARALLHEPRLLILDEPTAGVDIEIRRSMWEFLQAINAAGTTIILTTHYLEEAESLCRQIAIIDQGRIIEHTTMKRLLGKLNVETFVLDLRQHVERAPSIAGYDLRLLDETTLEVDVSKERSINELFQWLTDHGIEVVSMRNKSNRLEELFLRLLARNGEAPAIAETNR